MARKKSDIVIPAQDWVDFILKEELIVTSKKEMIELGIEKGPRVAAIAGIVSRLLGHAPDDILNPNKNILLKGAAYQIYYHIRTMREEIELDSGKIVSVPQYNKPYVMSSRDEKTDDVTFESTVEAMAHDDEGYAEVKSQMFYENAVHYLHNPVMGHIRNRLTEVAVCKGLEEARKEADALIDRVTEITDDLYETNNQTDD